MWDPVYFVILNAFELSNERDICNVTDSLANLSIKVKTTKSIKFCDKIPQIFKFYLEYWSEFKFYYLFLFFNFDEKSIKKF